MINLYFMYFSFILNRAFEEMKQDKQDRLMNSQEYNNYKKEKEKKTGKMNKSDNKKEVTKKKIHRGANGIVPGTNSWTNNINKHWESDDIAAHMTGYEKMNDPMDIDMDIDIDGDGEKLLNYLINREQEEQEHQGQIHFIYDSVPSDGVFFTDDYINEVTDSNITNEIEQKSMDGISKRKSIGILPDGFGILEENMENSWSRESILGWNSKKITIFEGRERNPDRFLEEFTLPGVNEYKKSVKLTKKEARLLKEMVSRMGNRKIEWGRLSLSFPHRTGNFLKKSYGDMVRRNENLNKNNVGEGTIVVDTQGNPHGRIYEESSFFDYMSHEKVIKIVREVEKIIGNNVVSRKKTFVGNGLPSSSERKIQTTLLNFFTDKKPRSNSGFYIDIHDGYNEKSFEYYDNGSGGGVGENDECGGDEDDYKKNGYTKREPPQVYFNDSGSSHNKYSLESSSSEKEKKKRPSKNVKPIETKPQKLPTLPKEVEKSKIIDLDLLSQLLKEKKEKEENGKNGYFLDKRTAKKLKNGIESDVKKSPQPVSIKRKRGRPPKNKNLIKNNGGLPVTSNDLVIGDNRKGDELDKSEGGSQGNTDSNKVNKNHDKRKRNNSGNGEDGADDSGDGEDGECKYIIPPPQQPYSFNQPRKIEVMEGRVTRVEGRVIISQTPKKKKKIEIKVIKVNHLLPREKIFFKKTTKLDDASPNEVKVYFDDITKKEKTLVKSVIINLIDESTIKRFLNIMEPILHSAYEDFALSRTLFVVGIAPKFLQETRKFFQKHKFYQIETLSVLKKGFDDCPVVEERTSTFGQDHITYYFFRSDKSVHYDYQKNSDVVVDVFSGSLVPFGMIVAIDTLLFSLSVEFYLQYGESLTTLNPYIENVELERKSKLRETFVYIMMGHGETEVDNQMRLLNVENKTDILKKWRLLNI